MSDLMYNIECKDCPRAISCYEIAVEASGDRGAAEYMVSSTEFVLNLCQQVYRNMQFLEATGKPGQLDQERAMVREMAGVSLPTAAEKVIACRNELEVRQEHAVATRNAEDNAKEKYNSLTAGCNGPKVGRVLKWTIRRCQGNL